MVQKPAGQREAIAGPDTPQQPYPLRLRGPVIKGFGRGSKELGIPTANIPLEGLDINGHTDLESGIYYGWASLDYSTIPSYTTTTEATEQQSSNHAVADLEAPSEGANGEAQEKKDDLASTTSNGKIVYPTVLSIGYNPYYSNPTRSIEIHILSSFPRDFYGATLSLLILGYIRPEYDYVSKEALVEDIREDIRVAQRSLARRGYTDLRTDSWLSGEEEAGEGEGEREREGKASAEEKKAGLRTRGEKGGLNPNGTCMMDP